MSRKMTLKKLSHRVTVCSMQDVVDENGTMTLRRKEAFDSWAAIEPKKGAQFSVEGVAIRQNRDARTHVICMRNRRDTDISSAAWIYEERRQSSPRWFKIINHHNYDEQSEFWKFDCRLVERSDDAERPEQVADSDLIKAGALGAPQSLTQPVKQTVKL